MGPNFMTHSAFDDRFQDDPGYSDLLLVAHECSAVTAACLLTKRLDYVAVGGMDEVRFPVDFSDVDYCLKLRSISKRTVFTPHARLLHLALASRGSDRTADGTARFNHELRALRARWGECLVNDPYYNPTLSLNEAPFAALAWPPHDMVPRIQRSLPPADIPPGP